MSDKSFDLVNASGNLLEAALHFQRCLRGEGASHDDARLALNDIAMAAELLEGAVKSLKNITEAFVGSRQLPSAKVMQAVQDMGELQSGLKLAKSAAGAAWEALCPDLNRGIPESVPATPADTETVSS